MDQAQHSRVGQNPSGGIPVSETVGEFGGTHVSSGAGCNNCDRGAIRTNCRSHRTSTWKTSEGITTSFGHRSANTALSRLVAADKGEMKVAANRSEILAGLMLDYQIINGSLTNVTFQGDTTYYISGAVNLYGTNRLKVVRC